MKKLWLAIFVFGATGCSKGKVTLSDDGVDAFKVKSAVWLHVLAKDSADNYDSILVTNTPKTCKTLQEAIPAVNKLLKEHQEQYDTLDEYDYEGYCDLQADLYTTVGEQLDPIVGEGKKTFGFDFVDDEDWGKPISDGTWTANVDEDKHFYASMSYHKKNMYTEMSKIYADCDEDGYEYDPEIYDELADSWGVTEDAELTISKTKDEKKFKATLTGGLDDNSSDDDDDDAEMDVEMNFNATYCEIDASSYEYLYFYYFG
ncbi:MAG: hypothetical protein HN348_26390 [Proteobacteria bacterium]|jgi:hypothetical protein|nr:hypothetical protein [Pseudomonadota bacterium]